MGRGILLLFGVALVVFGVGVSLVRLHVDGLSALAIAGLLIAVLANRWERGPIDA